VGAVFWPLIAGFIAVVIITLLIGRITDSSGRDGAGGDH
jgi:Flp pilus assembly pilin Flp